MHQYHPYLARFMNFIDTSIDYTKETLIEKVTTEQQTLKGRIIYWHTNMWKMTLVTVIHSGSDSDGNSDHR